MYFWNTKALSEDIKKRKLSDKDWKNYYLAGCILVTLLTYMTELNPRENTTSILIEAILNIGIIIVIVTSLRLQIVQFASFNWRCNGITDVTVIDFIIIIIVI